jgi:hypothetical protein
LLMSLQSYTAERIPKRGTNDSIDSDVDHCFISSPF